MHDDDGSYAVSTLKKELERYPDNGEAAGLLARIGEKAQDRQGLTWKEVRKRKPLKLYAGDIFNPELYEGLVGLSITRSDERHVLHDVTHPIPLPDNSTDSFQSEDVFEHIPYEKLIPVVDEIYRILKPDGLFRLSLPDYGCDMLNNRTVKDSSGQLIFDPEGGGTPDAPGHLWFPQLDMVRNLLERTRFHSGGAIEYLHYYHMDSSFVLKPVDYAKGHISRTPDFDSRAKNPHRPMSMIIDLTKSLHPCSDGKKVLRKCKRTMSVLRGRKLK